MIKNENEELLSDSNSILNRWKNYFSQLLNVHKGNDVGEIQIQTAEPLIAKPTLLEVEIAIEKLKKYKSPGINQILPELIQDGRNSLLFIAIWKKVLLPEPWMESIIIPIHKNGEKTNCNNYRGISLLLTSHKILSNIILGRLHLT